MTTSNATNDTSANQSSPRDGRAETVREVVDSVLKVTDSETVTLGDLIISAGRASFTPLLFLPAVALATPLSGIPMFSTTMGILIFLVALQMLMGRDHLWMPTWLLNMQTKTGRIRDAFGRLDPVVTWLDNRTHKRLTFLAHRPFVFVPQLLCLVSGLIIPLLEFVPFSSSLMGVAVALLALGMLARDGAMLLIAFLPYVSVGWLMSRFLA